MRRALARLVAFLRPVPVIPGRGGRPCGRTAASRQLRAAYLDTL